MKLTESNSVNFDKPLAESAVAPGECGSVPDEPSEDESLIACLGGDAAKLMQANPGDEMATTMLVAAIRISQLLSRMQPPNNQPNSDHVAFIGAKSDSVHLDKPAETATDTSLLPCPFCGSVRIIVGYIGQPALSFHMACDGCRARGPSLPSVNPAGGAFNPEIAPAWNRRTTFTKAQLIRAFNSGYMLGHHDTVEGIFSDIHWSDMKTYNEDYVDDLIADDALPAAQSGISLLVGRPNEKDVVGEGK